MKLTLSSVKSTPGTVVFSETTDPEDFLATPNLKNVYFPKPFLASLGWQPGKDIEVNITVSK